MIPTVAETMSFILRAHAGHVDKAGRPYSLHPISVMHRLGDTASDDEKLVALLHDVIEDTPYKETDLLAMGYPAHVVEAVKLLSRPKHQPPYMNWIRSIAESGNRLAIRAKIADAEDNSDPNRVALLPPAERGGAARYVEAANILRAAL